MYRALSSLAVENRPLDSQNETGSGNGDDDRRQDVEENGDDEGIEHGGFLWTLQYRTESVET